MLCVGACGGWVCGNVGCVCVVRWGVWGVRCRYVVGVCTRMGVSVCARRGVCVGLGVLCPYFSGAYFIRSIT